MRRSILKYRPKGGKDKGGDRSKVGNGKRGSAKPVKSWWLDGVV